MGVAIGSATAHQTQSASSASVLPGAGAPAAQPPDDSGTSPSGSTSNGSGATSSVVASVSQAVVDLTATTSNGQVAGTGMVITSDGEVLTNNHVVAGTSNIRAQIDGSGPRYTVTVVGVDPSDDVALVRMQGVSGLKTVSFADSSNVSVGDAVTAIGNAGNQPGAPSSATGSVVSLGRTITASDDGGGSETLTGLIQIDAMLQPGDSGGPLIDSSGRVVGMDTAAQSNPGLQSASNIGFAIPIDNALRIARQIEAGDFSATVQGAHGAFLGVEVSGTRGRSVSGAAIVGVQSGSPAQSAGIAGGDLITSVGGHSVDSASSLQSVIRAFRPGQTATVTWVTASGQPRSAGVTFAAGPPA